jgi:hypothetical protein
LKPHAIHLTPAAPRSEHPLCFALGSFHNFLSAEQAATCTPEERIKSVWPYILNTVRGFTRTLTPRELANYDEEDVLIEVWIAIKERDHKWNPQRGKYISFVCPIVHRFLYGLREQTRTVQSGANTSSRMKKFQQEARHGELTKVKRRTMTAMEHSIAGPLQITQEHDSSDTAPAPDLELISIEEQKETINGVMDALKQVSILEAAVMGAYLGLWGQEPKSFAQIACRLGKTTTAVRRVYTTVVARLVASRKTYLTT